MKELRKMLNALTYRDLTKSNCSLILSIIDSNDLDDTDVKEEVELFADRVNKPFILIDEKLFGEERKKENLISKLTLQTSTKGVYSASQMATPWNILEDIGYNIYQDDSSTKDLYWLKSIERIGQEKKQIIKTTKESLINQLNSWAYEHQLYWNKTINDSNGNVISVNKKLIDFKEADLTRFAHRRIVFDPTNTTNTCVFEGKECLNSYTVPENLHLSGKSTSEIPKNLELFYNLLFNICGEDNKGAEYLIHWLAHNYQTKKKHEKMMVFVGEGRTGKGLLMEVITALYGEKYIGIGDKVNNIFEKEANKELKNKLYYHADEIEITKDNWSTVKRLTGTNHKFLLKELYADSRSYPNTANFVFNLNTHKGEIPFAIPEQGDLRFCCFEAWVPLINQPWWDSKSKTGSYNQLMHKDYIKEIGLLLSTFEYSNQLLLKPYDNDVRKRMLRGGQSNAQGFTTALLTKDYDWLDDNGLDTIVWWNNNGERAKGYDWTQHLKKCYENGYITLKDSKNLFTQLFPNDLYKTTQLIAEGMVEKNQLIEHNGIMKSTRIFELPCEIRDTKRTLRSKIRGDSNE